MKSQYYTLNEDNVTYNDFDDETIVIHLTSANYFSLRESSAAIWKLLAEQPLSAESLVTAFTAGTEETLDSLDRFLSELFSHDLVLPTETPASAPSLDGKGLDFAEPSLEPFDDLRELLLADIIHDTDDRGWPHLANEGSEVSPG